MASCHHPALRNTTLNSKAALTKNLIGITTIPRCSATKCPYWRERGGGRQYGAQKGTRAERHAIMMCDVMMHKVSPVQQGGHTARRGGRGKNRTLTWKGRSDTQRRGGTRGTGAAKGAKVAGCHPQQQQAAAAAGGTQHREVQQ